MANRAVRDSRSVRPLTAALVAAASLLAACTGTTSGSGSTHNGSTGASPGGSSTSAPRHCSADDNESVSNAEQLARTVSLALQHHSEKHFVDLAATSAVERQLRTWWRNVSTIGFTTGAASTDFGDKTVTLTIGLHNKLDIIDTDDKPAEPMAPATQYRVRVVAGGADCKQATIASWKPLSGAPYDSSARFKVVHTPHVEVVAKTAVSRALMHRVARAGEKAAQWIFRLMKSAHHRDYVQQRGFVVFLATNRHEGSAWFRGAVRKPHGWIADVGNVAGFNFPLPEPIVSGGDGVKKFPAGGTGGARVVITPTGLKKKGLELAALMTHEFTHDFLTTDDVWSYGGGKPLPAATAEGSARWFEAMYLASRGTLHNVHSVQVLGPVVRRYRFSGRVPSDGQVYGSAKYANYYYDLSATTFSYLAARYGFEFAIQCMRDAYVNHGGPFGGVVQSIKHGTITFMSPSVLESRWALWVRDGFPDRPAR